MKMTFLSVRDLWNPSSSVPCLHPDSNKNFSHSKENKPYHTVGKSASGQGPMPLLRAYPDFSASHDFYSFLDDMLVHRRITPQHHYLPVLMYTSGWEEALLVLSVCPWKQCDDAGQDLYTHQLIHSPKQSAIH